MRFHRVGLLALSLLFAAVPTSAQQAAGQGFDVQTRRPFLSGMNLAWMNFGYDLSQFDEVKFVKALDQISLAGGNTLRWWLHVNGSDTPSWGSDGLPEALPDTDVVALKRALDLAAERGVGLVLCLWSFDMLNPTAGVDVKRNKKLLEDDKLLQAYLDRTLTPVARLLGRHPALLAWEVFNEPEGMLASGWSKERVEPKTVQRFVNRVAGALHRAVSGILVTNGSASFATQSDVAGINLYRDDRLKAAGGDADGVLDFYSVHYYPEHHGEALSPFHHPASYWKLDKPVVIGEFPSKGIRDVGTGFLPRTSLDTVQAYSWAFDQGYAGALSWTMTNHDGFGGIDETRPALASLKQAHPAALTLQTSGYNHSPAMTSPLRPLALPLGTEQVVTLSDFVQDKEDGRPAFSLGNVSGESVEASLSGDRLTLRSGNSTETATVSLEAADFGGNKLFFELLVHVVDPNRGDVALLKPVYELVPGHVERRELGANDGDPDTAWNVPEHATLVFRLNGKFRLSRASFDWDGGVPLHAVLEISPDDGRNWVKAADLSTANDMDAVPLAVARATHFRLRILDRGPAELLALRELRVEGERL